MADRTPEQTRIFRPARDDRGIKPRNAARIQNLDGSRDFIVRRRGRVVVHARKAVHLNIHPSRSNPRRWPLWRRTNLRNRAVAGCSVEGNLDGRASKGVNSRTSRHGFALFTGLPHRYSGKYNIYLMKEPVEKRVEGPIFASAAARSRATKEEFIPAQSER